MTHLASMTKSKNIRKYMENYGNILNAPHPLHLQILDHVHLSTLLELCDQLLRGAVDVRPSGGHCVSGQRPVAVPRNFGELGSDFGALLALRYAKNVYIYIYIYIHTYIYIIYIIDF
jgi:hypothetical protein